MCVCVFCAIFSVEFYFSVFHPLCVRTLSRWSLCECIDIHHKRLCLLDRLFLYNTDLNVDAMTHLVAGLQDNFTLASLNLGELPRIMFDSS